MVYGNIKSCTDSDIDRKCGLYFLVHAWSCQVYERASGRVALARFARR